MRVLVFCDFGNLRTGLLVRAVFDEVARRPGWSIVGLCDAGRGRGMAAPLPWQVSPDRRLVRRADQAGAPVVRPPQRSVNDQAAVARIAELAPELGIALLCPQVFGPDLLAVLPVAVNLHDAALPDHAGLSATSFSLYEGETTSGFTYHLIDAGIDTGRVLVQGSVSVSAHDDLRAVADRKASAAASALPLVLDRVARGDRGALQDGIRRYHSRDDTVRVIHVADPSAIEAAELARRLRAFGTVRLPTDAGPLWVTGLGPRRPGRPAVRLADRTVHVSRIAGIPALPYRLARRARRLLPTS